MSQQPRSAEVQYTRRDRLDYLLFLPKLYGLNRDQRWPLILFLHGAGERGSDLELVKRYGLPKVLETWQECPFIVVSPQCGADTWWTFKLDALNALLDSLIAEYAVDTARLYLTGMSMGGHGAWHLALAYPERFAAIAPICGRGNRSIAGRIKDVPAWVFHGAKDETVPLDESERMVEALQALGGELRFTVYPDAGHDSWTETYDNPELYSGSCNTPGDDTPCYLP